MSHSTAAMQVHTRRSKTRAAHRIASGIAMTQRELGSLDPILDTQIRRQFFSIPVEVARYRVSLSEVVDHLVCAGLAITPRPQRALAHLADVMQVVACVRGDATAWNDVLNAHAWCLDRACAEQLGTTQGLTFARRFWRDLKQATIGQATGMTVTAHHAADAAALARRVATVTAATRLQNYSGVRPLRLWLADRMLGAAANGAVMRGGRSPASLDSDGGSRTLPLPVGQVGGTAT